MSAQPTPSLEKYQVNELYADHQLFWDVTGPGDFFLRHSIRRDAEDLKIRLEHSFAQGQASSAKEVEVYRKALEDCIKKLNQLNQCSYGKYCKDEAGVCQFIEKQKALLTLKHEPVAQGHDGNCVPVRTPDDGWKCDCGQAPVAPVRKWEAEEEK